MEAEVAQKLLVGKSPVVVQVSLFQFADELRSSGKLVTLGRVVRQQVRVAVFSVTNAPPGIFFVFCFFKKNSVELQTLSTATLAALAAEIDTQFQAEMLLAFLNDCRSFVSAVWGTSTSMIVNSTQLLEQFALNILLMNPGDLHALFTPALRRADLSHLQVCFAVWVVFFHVC
jgi:hypothetical protein